MKACDNCNEDLDMGIKYYYGEGVEKDYSKAFEIFSRLAEQGDAAAQNNLGVMYDGGYGVDRDYVKAKDWYERAAGQGDAAAQYNLACMYEDGHGVERDDARAAEWYEKAAAQGHDRAQNNLAYLYKKGYGVPKDLTKAVALYEKAARQGCAKAQTNLGHMYRYGSEIEQDYVKAAAWFRRAAEQGDATGQICLAKLYDEGNGVPQDYAEAAKWYENAAKQGVKAAAARLGKMYETGEGVPRDPEKAAYWSKEGVVMRCWAYNMGTLHRRKIRYDKLNEVIARVSSQELKNELIAVRDAYWKRIGELNKPDYTDNDRDQIQMEHDRIDKLLGRMVKIAAGIPAQHLLYCTYPGCEFREVIEAAQVGLSYEDDNEAYRDKLYGLIDKILAEQNLEQLMEIHYRDYDVIPAGRYTYSGVLKTITEKRPWGYDADLKLDNIGYDGKVIGTESIDVAGFFERNPEYLQKPYMYPTANEYISVALERYVEDSCWQIELYNENMSVRKFCGQFKLHNSGHFPVYGHNLHNYDYFDYGVAHGLDNPENWPVPRADGTWVDGNGKRCYPRLLYGLKNKQTDDDMWVVDGSDLELWYNQDTISRIVCFDTGNQAGSYDGYVPDMKEIRESCPVQLEPGDTPKSINQKIQAFFLEQYHKVQQVPAKYLLYCDYPGLEFRTEFMASELDSSYEEDPYEYYREALEERVYNELCEQGVEELLNVHYTVDEVVPQGCFTYYEVINNMQSYPPHNENVKIYLDTVDQEGTVIKTEEITIMDVFIRDPEFFQEGGMYGAAYEYVEASLMKFAEDAEWYSALEKNGRLIADVHLWPAPNSDGAWTDKDGSEMNPYLWYGCEDSRVNGENTLWSADNIEFWFSDDPSWEICGFCNDEDYYSYRNGFVPDVNSIRQSCPILLEADDTSDSINEKLQHYFLELYRKAHAE